MDASARELSARIRRNAVLIAGGQALTSVIVQINSVIAALVIYGLTGDAILAGGVSAVIYAGGIPASYLSGWLMDRFGRRPVLVLGGGLTGLSMIGLATFYLFASVTGMIAMFLLFGVGRAVLNQNRVAIADMFPSSSLGRAFGYLYTASVLGAILTVPLVGVIEPYSQSLGVKSSALLWITSAALGCVVATLIAAVRPDPREIAKAVKLDDPTDPREFRESVVRIPLPVASSFLISALASGIMVTMMSLLSLHMSIHGFALTLITLSVTFHVIGMYGLSLPFGRLVDTIGPKKVMTAGILMTGIGGLLTPLTVEYNVISAAIFLVGLGWSATNISSSSVISAMAETGARGRVLGLNDLAIGMASVAGPLFGGLVISDYGFFAWGLYGFLLSVPGFLLAVGTKFSPERFPP